MPQRKKKTRKIGGGNNNNNAPAAGLCARLGTCFRKRKAKTNKKKNNNAPAVTAQENNGLVFDGPPLAEMPQLCFGTYQGAGTLDKTLRKALNLGYRHIDCAEKYADQHMRYGIDYKKLIRKVLLDFQPIMKRNELWITWKDNHITVQKIRDTIERTGCKYFDLYLVHHSCGSPEDFAALQEAQTLGLIRYYGVSNCEDLDRVRELKERYDIYANQIRARPPGGKVTSRIDMDPNFIEESNKLGVRIMLFGTITSIENRYEIFTISREQNLEYRKHRTNINKYYMQKFLLPFNVLIVSSSSGETLAPNLNDFQTIMSGKPLLSEREMKTIEDFLLTLELYSP